MVIFLHSAFLRPHLQYTLSNFEPSSATKTWINCNKINGVPPLHGRNLSTCTVKRGCRSWAYSAWRRDGFGGTQQQPAPADREITEKTNSSLMVAGGQETLSLSWGSDISEVLFHQITVRVEQVAQKYCAVSILRDLQGQTGQNSEQSHLTLELKLLWARGWTRHIPSISQWFLWNYKAVKKPTN